jgi:AraC-like DNA-binding protein
VTSVPQELLRKDWVAATAVAAYARLVEPEERGDAVMAAMRDVLAALGAVERNIESIRQRAHFVMRSHLAGHTWSEIMDDDGPIIVRTLTECVEHLNQAGSQLRRRQAAQLHAEGMTMEEIAERFGVSRQRVSKLISAVEGSTRPEGVVHLRDSGGEGDE